MKNLIIFLAFGAAAGVAGYKIGYSQSKKKYESLADEEVASVKAKLIEHYEKKSKELPNPKNSSKNEPIDSEEPSKKGSKVIKTKTIDYGKRYRTDSEPERIPGKPNDEIIHLKKEEVDTTKPYIITAEEFNDSENECVSLFYTADKVLTDDDYNQINNIGIVGGYRILDKIGIYDADCLYVRDEAKGIDYEILLEERTYNKLKPLGVVEEY